MAKVLLVAAIGRGHALAEKFKHSGVDVYSFIPFANPGIIACSLQYKIGDVLDTAKVAEYAKEVEPDYVFIAGDDPIAAGVADAVKKEGFDAIAPFKSVARLESDKAFAREFMKEYVPEGCPRFDVFRDVKAACDFIDSVPYEFVIKPVGLTGGKGVKVLGQQLKNRSEAKIYAESAIQNDSAGGIVIEEKLFGEEYSMQCFVDGEFVAPMPLAQDHKPAFDGDTGPMTGGMGAYTMQDGRLPFLSDQDYHASLSIVKKTVLGIRDKTGEKFKGVLYAQFMLTSNGPYLIEYNVRLGDPEAMNVLPLMKTNFHDVCKAIVEEELERFKVEFEPLASVCKYVVPQGYPERKDTFKFDLGIVPDGVNLFYSGVEQKQDGIYTTGSRGFGLTAMAPSLQEAYDRVEGALGQLNLSGFRYRKDIASHESIERKIQRMNAMRMPPAPPFVSAESYTVVRE